MRHTTASRALPVCAALATAVIVSASAGTAWAAAPVKLVLSSRIGSEVDKTTGGKICTTESKDECQPAKRSHEAGGFEFPEGIGVNTNPAGPHQGDVYVADRSNNRVQELSPTGEFVAMFGWEVNETKDKESGATPAERDICTAASGDVCKAGVDGTGAGQFESLQSVTVAPATGDVYVQEGSSNQRVEKYTADGQFVWMAGKEVNETKDKESGATPAEKDICTAASGNVCKAGVPSSEPGGFDFQGFGNLLATGGAAGDLYVGDAGRVQEYDATGALQGNISLTGNVTALAVDPAGDLYVVFSASGEVNELDGEGKEVHSFEVTPRETGNQIFITQVALDPSGHLAVTGTEAGHGPFGSLYLATTGHLITRFTIPARSRPDGIAFNASGDLYATAEQEVLAYTHLPVAELLTAPQTCAPGPAPGTSVVFSCNLNGEVDAWGVKETEVWFEWGTSPDLGRKTEPPIHVNNIKNEGEEEPLVPVTALIENLPPNQTIYYRLAGHDHNAPAPEEALTSETASFKTDIVAPRIVGEPSAAFVKSSSAVMFGQLNPENDHTTYEFRYAPFDACKSLEESCPGAMETASLESSAYGDVGVVAEATGLRPGEQYRYRLFAVNDAHEPALNGNGEEQIDEGSFTTLAAPVPSAVTGAVSAVGPTSATVSGAVDPDGQPATYTFELGIYKGTGTQYGVVASGPVEASSVAVERTLQLTGLQPGTTYAYRITVTSGYGTSEGMPQSFTTAGLSGVLPVEGPVPMLAKPRIAFPKKTVPCKRGHTRDKHGKCVKKKRKRAKGRSGRARGAGKR
jgi:hypothetical protein